MWRGGIPSLRLLTSTLPEHGFLLSNGERLLGIGAEIPLQLFSSSGLRYVHDDSGTMEDK